MSSMTQRDLDVQAGVTEEDYYFSEYTAKEREEGLHLAAMKFVSSNCIRVRGCKAAGPAAHTAC